MAEQEFHGCKAALFIGDRLVTILRDDKPDIPWPGHWDFPGGGREGTETPEETVLREINEELGLILSEKDVVWRKWYRADFDENYGVYFFVIKLESDAERAIVFGDEGQEWMLVTPDTYYAMEQTIPMYRVRLRDWMEHVQ